MDFFSAPFNSGKFIQQLRRTSERIVKILEAAVESDAVLDEILDQENNIWDAPDEEGLVGAEDDQDEDAYNDLRPRKSEKHL